MDFGTTVSTLEVIRFAVALYGLHVSWIGRRLARITQEELADNHPASLHDRAAREARAARMVLFENLQGSIMLVHTLLLVNVTANLFYASSSIENVNVMTSNAAQVLIPLILMRASELISMEMREITRIQGIVGPRPSQEHA